jgi:hypothetical protein
MQISITLSLLPDVFITCHHTNLTCQMTMIPKFALSLEHIFCDLIFIKEV